MDITEKKIEMDIQERISSLPEEITEIVTLGFFDDVMDEVVQQFQITNQQRALLENETLLVLLFFSSLEEFPNNIQTTLEIDNEKALAISTYIQKELFSLVENYFEENETDDQELTVTQTDVPEDDLQPQSDIESDERFKSEEETENQSTETENDEPRWVSTQPTLSDPNDISPLRTMKTDAERAGASEQKENPKKSVAELPRYVQEEDENT